MTLAHLHAYKQFNWGQVIKPNLLLAQACLIVLSKIKGLDIFHCMTLGLIHNERRTHSYQVLLNQAHQDHVLRQSEVYIYNV